MQRKSLDCLCAALSGSGPTPASGSSSASSARARATTFPKNPWRISAEISQYYLEANCRSFRCGWRPMTEREIFLDALEQEDSGARAAYLDAVCAGRPALRRRVEELLRLHREDPTFLNVPAMEQMAAAEESLTFLWPSTQPCSLGRLDHYEVLEVIGRGS